MEKFKSPYLTKYRRFGYEFSVLDSDEVDIFCMSRSVLLDVCTPSIAENALREISRVSEPV